MFIGWNLRWSFISVEVARKEKQQMIGKCVCSGTAIERKDEAEIDTNLFANIYLKTAPEEYL